MKRLILFAALLMLAPSVAAGKRAPGNVPAASAATVGTVLVGTVTEIDKDPVSVASAPGAKDTVAYTVATVKVTDAIRGLKSETHVKVGFQPSRRGGTNLDEKQTYLFFLSKHPVGNFYVMDWMNAPLPINEASKASVEQVKAIAKILGDPDKALEAKKPEDRALAAMVLILHHRTPSATGVAQTTEALPLAESQAILKAYGAVDWMATPEIGGLPVLRQFYSLGLGADAGWKQPEVKPGEDGTVALQKAYAEWLAGAGAKYQIQKFVAKKN